MSSQNCRPLKRFLPNALAALVSENRHRHYIFEEYNIIGRNENAFITLRDFQISRIHCIIEKTKDNKFTICDKSTRGTFLNEKQLVKDKPEELHHHDKITLINSENFPFIFLLNKNSKEFLATKEEINSKMKEKMLSLDCSHSDEMQKLNHKIYLMETEKSGLKENMNSKLEAQEKKFNEERLNLTNLVTTSEEQKCEAERRLKEIEEASKMEKDQYMRKIKDITEKEMELQQLKKDLQLRHQQEREELEERCKLEIEDLKERLADSEMEQGRFQEEIREVEQKLEETKKVLLESEIQQFRLIEEKVQVESKLKDLTKESTSKDETVRNLEKRLKEKEEAEERARKDMEDLEEQLQCSICAELFIEATVLNCGHMFCKECIEEWKTKKKICPMCRAKITSSVRIFTLDTIIEKNVAMLSKEAQDRRQDVIRQRQEGCQPPKKRKSNHRATSARISTRHPQPQPAHDLPIFPGIIEWGHYTNRPNINQNVNYPIQRMQPFNPEPFVQMRDLNEDPFALQFHGRRTRGRVSETPGLLERPVDPPVAVAAIDLTNIPVSHTPPILPTPATSTILNDTIDLTSSF